MNMTRNAASLLSLCTLLTAFATAEVAQSPGEIRPLLPGSSIPSVALATLEGEPFELEDAVREKPVVLIFYRGGW